jgi:hypothetical protein
VEVVVVVVFEEDVEVDWIERPSVIVEVDEPALIAVGWGLLARDNRISRIEQAFLG